MALLLSKSLSKSDVDEKCSVPKEWIHEYWPNISLKCEVRLRVRHQISESSGKWYEFVLSTRKSGDYTKPVFKSKGWHNFVKDNRLQENSVIRFGKRNGEDHFTIIIEHNFF